MLQESISDQEEVLVFTWEAAFVDHKVTLFMTRFVQILFRINFKDVVAHLEANWFDF